MRRYFGPADIRDDAERLGWWQERTAAYVARREDMMARLAFERWQGGVRGVPRIGGGAPQLPVTLAVMIDTAANTTWTAAQSIIGNSATPGPAFTGPVGPFSVDYFRAETACWMQEAMGIISTTGTPTIAFGTYFGVVVGTITTVLNITPTITTASALANINWYWKAIGRTVTNNGANSTTLCTGMLFGNIEVLAASVAGEPIQYAVNATPPTAVTTDFSTTVCLDLKATWGTSSASNAITCTYYDLTSRYS